MKVINDEIAFPDDDEFMVLELQGGLLYQAHHLKSALRHVTDWSLAVDGGAHVGTWTRIMCEHFQRVIAVEPSPDTFEALCWNVSKWGVGDRADLRNVALGATNGRVVMALDAPQAARKNTGARHVEPGGNLPLVTLDSWQLESLGFRKLDVEGSEFPALQGATATLLRCQPIVLFEEKGLGAKHFGHKPREAQRFLTDVGYARRERAGCDEIWGPK